MEEISVYLVEDDANVRRSLEFMLRTHGVRCRGFANGEEFLAAADRLGAGCILLDLRLPGVSGLTVLAELARRGNRSPVIAMTGTRNAEEAERARALGAIDVLDKPFETEALLAGLRVAFAELAES
jgi:two-component system response regulator FixJ